MNFAKFIVWLHLFYALILLTVVACLLRGVLIVEVFMMNCKSLIIGLIMTRTDYIGNKFINWNKFRFPDYLIINRGAHLDDIIIFFIVLALIPMITGPLPMQSRFRLYLLLFRDSCMYIEILHYNRRVDLLTISIGNPLIWKHIALLMEYSVADSTLSL